MHVRKSFKTLMQNERTAGRKRFSLSSEEVLATCSFSLFMMISILSRRSTVFPYRLFGNVDDFACDRAFH